MAEYICVCKRACVCARALFSPNLGVIPCSVSLCMYVCVLHVNVRVLRRVNVYGV